MGLNLNDAASFDYGGGNDLFPYDVYGRFVFRVTSYTPSGPPGEGENKSDKEYDLATMTVLESDNPAMPVGTQTGFWFQTGGNGMTIKSRKYKQQELRAFVAALCDLPNPKDRTIDWVAKQKEAYAADYEKNTVKVGVTTSRGRPKGDNDFYRDDRWFIVS